MQESAGASGWLVWLPHPRITPHGGLRITPLELELDMVAEDHRTPRVAIIVTTGQVTVRPCHSPADSSRQNGSGSSQCRRWSQVITIGYSYCSHYVDPHELYLHLQLTSYICDKQNAVDLFSCSKKLQFVHQSIRPAVVVVEVSEWVVLLNTGLCLQKCHILNYHVLLRLSVILTHLFRRNNCGPFY